MGRLRSLVRHAAAWLGEDRWAVRFVLAFGLVQAGVATWDLPSSWGWEVDGVAPRELWAGLADNLRPGARHRYPLLHYVLIAIPSLPVLAVALFTTESFSASALEAEMVRAPIMTGVSVVAKGLTIVMGAVALLALSRIARKTFSATAGHWAIAFAALNLSFGYYARTTNLDVPYLMWTALAVDRLLVVAERGRRLDYFAFAVCTGAAVGTKDQAYASFVLPGLLFLVALPALGRALRDPERPHGRWLAQAIGVGALTLGVLGGGLLNPTGFAKRFETLIGPASQDFRVYERSLAGLAANIQDLFWAQDDFWWPGAIVIVAWAGVLVAIVKRPGAGVARRTWRLLPATVALSSLLFFTLVVGRCEHRFALPLGFWLSMYAGVAVTEAMGPAGGSLRRRAVGLGAAVLVALAAAGPASLILTQFADARYETERALASLPAGSRVETWGRLVYQPRLSGDGPYRAVHVHSTKPPHRRPPMPGVRLIRARYEDVIERAPDVLILPGAVVDKRTPTPASPGRLTSRHLARYRENEQVVTLVQRIVEDRVPGYHLAPVARAELPAWAEAIGLRPIEIHGSTGRPVFMLRRNGTEEGTPRDG